MPKLPNSTPVKDSPPPESEKSAMPFGFKIKTPEETQVINETPAETEEKKDTPEGTKEKEDLPSGLKEENCVVIGGNKIEIKPTKLKYFRNKAASGYGIIKNVPIYQLYTYEKGQLDPERSADELVYDFLVASFNDSAFVRDNYNEMDADNLDTICKIFGRINHIDEKEEAARKNMKAQEQAKR